MSDLNNSVIICDTSPKPMRRKVPLGLKKTQKKIKRTFYESPLKHIQLSSKKWEQLQSLRRSTRNAKNASNIGKSPFALVKDETLQDSVIILSDNECKSIAKEEKDSKERKTRKRSLKDKDDGDPCSKKRRKKSTIELSENNSSCLLISDTEESDIATVDLVDENLDPTSESVNQGLDDIIVVWSSTTISLTSEDQLKEKTKDLKETENQSKEKVIRQEKSETQTKENNNDEEKDNRLFMIDYNPDLNNLSCLVSNKQRLPKQSEENAEKENAEKKEQDSNSLPFSKKGLKLPKAHDISKKILVKKPQSVKRIRNFKRQERVFSTAQGIPVIGGSRLAPSSSLGCEASTSKLSELCGPGLYHTNTSEAQSSNRLREIVIDGNNVAMAHTNGKVFSESGLMLVIDYFKQRGHSVKVFVPQYRRSLTHPLLEKLYTAGIVVFTPSRSIGGRWITPYDDRYILEYATMCGGIVVSLDQYRDLYKEKPEWRDTIENRLLAPTFVGDYVMFPEDPLGRNGPKLNEFLRY